jgi:hypothetical protein
MANGLQTASQAHTHGTALSNTCCPRKRGEDMNMETYTLIYT